MTYAITGQLTITGLILWLSYLGMLVVRWFCFNDKHDYGDRWRWYMFWLGMSMNWALTFLFVIAVWSEQLSAGG